MFETHERILLKLAETGLKEFSVETVKEAMNKVEDEEIDRMYEEWRRETDSYSAHDAEPAPVSWDDATEDLGEMPYPELSQNREMEMER